MEFKIKKKQEADLVLYFKITFNLGHPNQHILTQGRIYLVRQQKVLVIPSNRQKVSFEKLGAWVHGKFFEGNPPIPNFKNRIEEAHLNGLQQLAEDARKVIHSHKFEKRQSNY